MIRIFNKKIGSQILIDETCSWIKFIPKDYESPPHCIIEMDDFDFYKHTFKCADCGSFYNDFGSKTTDWCINYMNKVFRIDLTFSKDQEKHGLGYKQISSDYQNGTFLKLYFHEFSTDKAELKIQLE